MGSRRRLKHLGPGENQTKKQFKKTPKLTAPWESGVGHGGTGGERKENRRSLPACQREWSPRHAGTHATASQRPAPLAGSLLKGKV